MGCSYFPSFICMHSFTTLKTSLIKQVSVSNSESDAGGQNCSVMPDTELVARQKGLMTNCSKAVTYQRKQNYNTYSN